jgi:hypothetical protein
MSDPTNHQLAEAPRGMIAMAIVGVVLAALGMVAPARPMWVCSGSHVDIAKLTVHKFADEAFPMWVRAHQDKQCPEKLEDLSEYMDSKDLKDPWGSSYTWFCGANLPAGAKGGFAVMSVGEDGIAGTLDDIRSWD